MRPSLLLLLTSLFTANTAAAATYYIDFTGGNDGNVGTGKTSAWQLHPFMKGFAGRYSHTAGDRFIFKGGVTWPSKCFQLRIAIGGSSDQIRDYYGVDPSWYSGSSWARPIFDFEDKQVGVGWQFGAGLLIEVPGNLVIDNLELKRHRSFLAPADYGASTITLSGNVSYVTIQNCYIHDWSIPVGGVGMDGGGEGGISQVNGWGPGNLVDRCTFSQAAAPGGQISGKAVHMSATVANCTIHDVASGFLGGGTIHDNHIYNLREPTDPAAHSNAIYTFVPSTIYNNVIHDTPTRAQVIYVSPNFTGMSGNDLIYNNVVYNVSQPCVAIDQEGPDSSNSGSRIYNNTLFAPGGSGWCIRVGPRQLLGLIDVRNNHLITTGMGVCYGNPAVGCGNVRSVTVVNNLVQTPSAAAASGYISSARFAPVSGTSPTVNKGVGLTEIFTADCLGTARATGAWDIGAYQFTGTRPRVNSAPVVGAIQFSAADASASQAGLQVAEGTTATVSASVNDPDGDPVSWSWRFGVNGAAATSYANGAGGLATATFYFGPGTGGNAYAWTLNATDGIESREAVFAVTVLPASQPAALRSGVAFEAESASLSAPFIAANGCVSQSIQTTSANGGRASYVFTAPATGQYTVQGFVEAVSEASNSFYVSIDAEPQGEASAWHVPITNGAEWRTVSWQGDGTWDKPAFAPKYFNLTAGSHTLRIVGREPGGKIDKLKITRVPAPPSNLRVVSAE